MSSMQIVLSVAGLILTVGLYLLNSIRGELRELRTELKELVHRQAEGNADFRELQKEVSLLPCKQGKKCNE